MSLSPLPKPACYIASSSHFHVVGISVSETVLDTKLRLDGTPENRRTQIAVCPKTREREHLVGHRALCLRLYSALHSDLLKDWLYLYVGANHAQHFRL